MTQPTPTDVPSAVDVIAGMEFWFGSNYVLTGEPAAKRVVAALEAAGYRIVPQPATPRIHPETIRRVQAVLDGTRPVEPQVERTVQDSTRTADETSNATQDVRICPNCDRETSADGWCSCAILSCCPGRHRLDRFCLLRRSPWPPPRPGSHESDLPHVNWPPVDGDWSEERWASFDAGRAWSRSHRVEQAKAEV